MGDGKTGGGIVPISASAMGGMTHVVRGRQVMLDSDLAALYGVETKNLNKAASRNGGRFPEDFRFQLGKDELEALRFQTGTSNEGRGGRRYLPWAYTEQSIAMLSSVLRSETAVRVSVQIMRAFVEMWRGRLGAAPGADASTARRSPGWRARGCGCPRWAADS